MPAGAAAASGRPLGPDFLHLQVAEGVSAGNVAALLFGSFFGIAMMGFINASQPYLFTEVLRVPAAEQGPLAGRHGGIAPFVLVAGANFTVMLLAILVWALTRRTPAARVAGAGVR